MKLRMFALCAILALAGCTESLQLCPPCPPCAAACVGDCNGDGTVTIDEMTILYRIAQGAALLGACPAGDVNGDGAVTVEELMLASTYAQDGCPK